MLLERTKGTPIVLALAVLVAVPMLAGCVGTGSDGSGAAAGEATTPRGDPIDPSDATQAMWEAGYKDPYLDTEPTGEVKEFDIWVRASTIEPVEGNEMFALTFATDPDGPYTVPAPEIRVTQGDTVRVRLHSAIHTIHWHGYDVPWEMDGVPFLTQGLGAPEGVEDPVYTYEFVAKQPGTYFYHCTLRFPIHLDLGMFGAFIVEPKDGPSLPYDREETLLLHERDSQLGAAFGMATNDDIEPDPDRLSDNPMDLADSAKRQSREAVDQAGLLVGDQTGVYGTSEGPRPYYPLDSPRYRPSYDTFMINGKSYPETEPVEIATGETLRLRLINTGQLPHMLHLHGHHGLVTHRDGYPLEAPYWADSIHLFPGERLDVYVQGTNPGIWNFHDHSSGAGLGAYAANDYAFPGGMKTVLAYTDFDPPGELPQPEGDGVTAGDLQVHAPSYHDR